MTVSNQLQATFKDYMNFCTFVAEMIPNEKTRGKI